MNDNTLEATIKLVMEYVSVPMEFFTELEYKLQPHFSRKEDINSVVWLGIVQLMFAKEYSIEFFNDLVCEPEMPYNIWAAIAILDDMVYDETFYTATKNLKMIHEGRESKRVICVL